MDLGDLLTRHEGKTLEFKREIHAPDRLLRTVVAFANSAGGVLLIGVEDRTRQVRGVPDALALVEKVTNVISDGVQPRLMAEVEVLAWKERDVVAIQIYPGGIGPYFLRSQGDERGVYVRVGPTNRQADRELIAELKRQARNEPYDEQTLLGTSSEAIDFRAASEHFAEIRKLRRSDLQALKLVTEHHGKQVATVGGMLLYGVESEREKHFPDARVEAARFDGLDRRKVLDSDTFRGYLADLAGLSIGFVKKHLSRAAIIGETRRSERWTLPMAAVREGIVNALVHADYSQPGSPIRVALYDDRLEIDNPGLLPMGMTIDDLFRNSSRVRNRVLARVFKELELIEQWGRGIEQIVGECRDAGLDPPQFEEIGTHFRVTISALPRRPATLDPLDEKILDTIREKGPLGTAELASAIDRTTRATRTRLRDLVDRGLLAELGTGPQDPRRTYALAVGR